MSPPSICRSPTFSILIPVHNAGGFLLGAVRSVLAQTCADFELILIDDGSSDGGLAPIASLGDARVRIVQQPPQGAPAALNAGLEAAQGAWIALLDHDDVWLPDKLAVHRACVAAHPELDLTFDWYRAIDAAGNDLGLGARCWWGQISFEQLLADWVVGTTSAMVIRRAAIDHVGGFNPAFPRLYDIDLSLRVAALRPGNCWAVPACLTLFRRHAGQMSRSRRAFYEEWRRFLSETAGCPPHPRSPLVRVADSNMRRYLAWLACEAANYGDASIMVTTALARAPERALFDARNWMVLTAALGGLLLPPALYERALVLGKRLAAAQGRASLANDVRPPRQLKGAAATSRLASAPETVSGPSAP